MKVKPIWIAQFIIIAASAGLCGCINLKPDSSTERYFVLSTVPASTNEYAAIVPATRPLVIGVVSVKLPTYLLKDYFAIRQSPNEVEYLQNSLWAEGLNQGCQRVLAGDLASRLPTNQMLLSTWRSDAVALEVHVSIQQFDVDTTGRGVLIAEWRILASGAENILNAGQFKAALNGPRPATDTQGAAATLSQLTAKLSSVIAQSIKELPVISGN